MSIASKPHLAEFFSRFKDRKMVVFWYGRVYPAITQDDHQPKIEIFLKELLTNGVLKKTTEVINVGIADAGLLPLGSIWFKGIRYGDLDSLVEETVEVSFDSCDLGLTELKNVDGILDNRVYEYPEGNVRLLLGCSKVITPKIINSECSQLVIPCTEIFHRFFGHGSELRRIIMTYEWDEVNSRCLLAGKMVGKDTWTIKLPKSMVNADSVQLAYMKFDKYAQDMMQDIRFNIHSHYSPKGAKYSEIRAVPWFEGKVRIRVKGFWVTKNKFLCLRISGASQPKGCTVIRIKDSSVSENTNGKDGQDGSPECFRAVIKGGAEVEVTNSQAPDRSGPQVYFDEENFTVLGEPREVKMLIEDVYDGRIRVIGDTNAAQFSTGERSGEGKGVGKASTRTPIEFESFGAVKDFWDELLQLEREHEISSIHFIAGGKVGFKEPLMLEAFTPIPQDEEVKITLGALRPLRNNEVPRIKRTEEERKAMKEKEIRNWAYLSKRMKIVRGALITCVTTKKLNSIYFIEIQRKKTKDKKEEAFKGTAFILDDDITFEESMSKIMSNLVRNSGVLKLKQENFPGKMISYKHTKSNQERRFYKNRFLSVIKDLDGWK